VRSYEKAAKAAGGYPDDLARRPRDTGAGRRARAGTAGLKLLHGTECNVAPDGSVDWDEDFLSGFDICVASVQTENPSPKPVNLQASVTGADDGVGACDAA
jgi:histidinol phosphatase-like PHP family hydrolase